MSEITQDTVCECGNVPEDDGFVACDENGIEMEPTAGLWTGLYSCQRCGKIYRAPEEVKP